ncbi:trypsin delta-like [Drosophila takahashii]|uniref:trypsin delta-like n=1 Tax=Drosophila takahashii TaxID=29030 RepID=UPI001CF888C1|nr:trypsin alpha-3-like [Drosophila takahashii]
MGFSGLKSHSTRTQFKMFIQWAFLISSATLISAGSISISERIVGGQPANISEVPWQVSLLKRGKHDCGAVIFSDDIVLTAAHCVLSNNLKKYSVRVGSSIANQGGQVVQIASIKRHDKYLKIFGSSFNDIAVIRLKTKLQLGDSVRPIPLADSAPAGGTPALVSGWGAIKHKGVNSKTLLKTTVNIVDRNVCGKSYKFMTQDMICAAAPGKDSCQGDSGGPLVVDGKLVGIVSNGKGCARPFYPGIYANVAVLKPWIEDNIKSLMYESK